MNLGGWLFVVGFALLKVGGLETIGHSDDAKGRVSLKSSLSFTSGGQASQTCAMIALILLLSNEYITIEAKSRTTKVRG